MSQNLDNAPASSTTPVIQSAVDKKYIRDIVAREMFCFRTNVILDAKTAIIVEAYAGNRLVSVKAIAPHDLPVLQTIKNNILDLGFIVKFLTNNKKIQLP